MFATADEAILKFARRKFNNKDIVNASIDLETDPGYPCCGGSNPGCYCSFATGPTNDIVLSASDGKLPSKGGKRYREVLGSGDDFTRILYLLLEIGAE